MLYFAEGGDAFKINAARAGVLLENMLSQMGELNRVLLLPPDITRLPSWAGALTVMLYQKLCISADVAIMPALGTHVPMSAEQLETMFPGIPHHVFRNHDWRNDLVRLGEVPGEFVAKVSEGKLDFPVYCEINHMLAKEKWDRIISIGQLVPHEVVGIANHNKNVFVGVGGQDTINKTHFIGAVYGMERMMGRAKSPVRSVLNYMSEHFLEDLPISYVLTVRAKSESGELVTRGIYAGDDAECYERGAELCQRVNLDLLDSPLKKVVVFLDPTEFHSTWLGNKAIYRTRMAMADDGELIILAPGVKMFGEDPEIDRLIRAFGYRGTPSTLKAVSENPELAANLSAAAHLIHGSSEGRFKITYCPGKLSRQEIESVGFEYADLSEMTDRYDPNRLVDGVNIMPDGEEVFFVSNPALGLWGLRKQFANADT